MQDKLPPRNYRVIKLVPYEGTYQVMIRCDSGKIIPAGTPSEFGLWGLTAKERAIVRRGMTSSGADKKAPKSR